MFSSGSTNQYTILDQCQQPITPLVVAPICPRCASPNTKFCYYNNYSLSQPRYFCKGCKRYWTKGGSLRNVPVGGGCRKSRRASRATKQGAVTPASDAPRVESMTINESRNNTDIDLAAVFAKYVNPNAENENSPEPEYVHVEDACTTFEYERSVGFINGVENQLQESFPDEDDLFYQNSIAFEFHGILDELNKGTDCTNLPAQPLTDFGVFSTVDQMRFSAHSVSDNWGSIDLSTYETLLRP